MVCQVTIKQMEVLLYSKELLMQLMITEWLLGKNSKYFSRLTVLSIPASIYTLDHWC